MDQILKNNKSLMPISTKAYQLIDENFILPSKHVIPNIKYLMPENADLTAGVSKSSEFIARKTSYASTDNLCRSQSRFNLQSKYSIREKKSENSDLI